MPLGIVPTIQLIRQPSCVNSSFPGHPRAAEPPTPAGKPFRGRAGPFPSPSVRGGETNENLAANARAVGELSAPNGEGGPTDAAAERCRAVPRPATLPRQSVEPPARSHPEADHRPSRCIGSSSADFGGQAGLRSRPAIIRRLLAKLSRRSWSFRSPRPARFRIRPQTWWMPLTGRPCVRPGITRNRNPPGPFCRVLRPA